MYFAGQDGKHDWSYKEAQSFMNSTKLFNVAGWKAVMGIDE